MSFRNSFRRIKSRFSRPRRSRSYASPRRSKRSRTIRKTKIFGFSLGTVAIILAAAYIFIAPVKTFVNGLIGKKDV